MLKVSGTRDLAARLRKDVAKIKGSIQRTHQNLVKRVLDVIIKRLARDKTILLEKIQGILAKPEIKKKNKAEIAHVARESVLEILERNKKKAAEHNASRQVPTKDINRDWGER